MRARQALHLRGNGLLVLGLVAVVVWLIGRHGPGHAEAFTTPLATSVVMNETSSKDVSVSHASAIRPDPNAASLSRLDLKTAKRDPFVIYAAPPPAPPAVVVTPVVVAPIFHREPMPSLSFAGRMHTHDGRVVVLARWADGTAVRLEEGKEVGNGFRVERMTEQSVELLNPRTQSMLQLSLPAAPRFETR